MTAVPIIDYNSILILVFCLLVQFCFEKGANADFLNSILDPICFEWYVECDRKFSRVVKKFSSAIKKRFIILIALMGGGGVYLN